MYSLISILIKASSESKRYLAKTLARYVLPTPVGPKKIKLPIGLLGSFKPALLRRIARTIFLIASSWPITVPCNSVSIFMSLSLSLCAILCTGTPVIIATTSATFSLVTTSRLELLFSSQSFFSASSFSRIVSSSLRSSPASSNFCSAIATFLSSRISSNLCSYSVILEGTFILLI